MDLILKDKSLEELKVSVFGEVSIEKREKLGDQFLEILSQMELEGIKKLIVDFSGLKYIDSMGISYFVKLKKTLKLKESELVFINTPDVIKKIFLLLSLDSYFNFQ